MNFYYAPMEGLTGYIYRNAHNKYFHSMDKYFSPFIVANQSDSFKTKEINDILPEHNQNLCLIPQLLTNNAKDFIHTSKKIKQLGYEEINLNLGCPSGTVVSKYRGAGFLAKTKALDEFLDEIFQASITQISIKTRIGKDDPDECYELFEIYNKYPMKELIIHPRIQRDFYKNKPNMKVFKEAINLCNQPLCYNGDLFTKKEYDSFSLNYNDIHTVMIGRGLLINPGLVEGILKNKKLEKETVRAFHDEIYEEYKKILFGDKNVLFKMKELWFYLIQVFEDNHKYGKKIRKTEHFCDYEEVINGLFRELKISE